MNEQSFICYGQIRPWCENLCPVEKKQNPMPRTLVNSNQHHQKALQKLPLGVSSNFRYWGEDKTIYIEKGRGGRLWDIDGNEYIDYRMGYGPGILGYAVPGVAGPAGGGWGLGGWLALPPDPKTEVAKRIQRWGPAA